tara:strand:- start:162 stop:953 length:792 start_codon:yes stop_codon:yes gene_type:complete
MKINANETPGFQFKRFALLGMSGLGKTFISRSLVKQDNWLHYSVDYEIGKILFKNKHRNLLNGFEVGNLTNLSDFLGKPGSPSMGGIPFSEYLTRQKLHRDAEIKATLHASSLVENSPELSHFVCDTSGSICELVNPSDENDAILKSLSKNFLIICLEAPDSMYQVLINRFLAKPKPMYYEENFLHSLWQSFKNESPNINDHINPDDFMIYGFKALIKRRKAIFDSISKNWGISLNFENLRVVKSAADLVKAIQFEIASKIKS